MHSGIKVLISPGNEASPEAHKMEEMHVPETQIEKLRFARRHLHLLAGVGIAAVLTA